MPGYPPDPPAPNGVPKQSHAAMKVQLVDPYGRKTTVTLEVENKAVTDADALLIAQALGQCSNAGVVSHKALNWQDIPESFAYAYDEQYSSIDAKLVLRYQNAQNTVKRFYIPAPDASILSDDGMSGNIEDPNLSALNDEILYALNERGLNDDTYELTSSYMVFYSRRGAQALQRPRTFTEPGETDLPPDEPGLDPVP